MYLIMTEGDLKVEMHNHRIRVNEGIWFSINPHMRNGTVRVEHGKIYMWRGLVEYEYNWQDNTYAPATTFDKFLSLFQWSL